ncbi:uncharacterized protein LOC120104627 [Phoenix dactylifera]|uniref:Uncharacterized protein LOC120104627 n=1 Tax=Phoenix dactylifera TaxID=42345 RepID=A0A8B8ZD55_PHODC|nr:uncharacterized protein LOC120104627 [Phoenix dactylifera]
MASEDTGSSVFMAICSYGSEAVIISISKDTILDQIFKEIVERWRHLSSTMIEVKFYIPNKSKMLVTLMSDKDVRNMHEIHVNLNAKVIEMVVTHSPTLIEGAAVVIESGSSHCAEISSRGKNFSKGSSSNFGQVVEETRAAIEEEASQKNSLDDWKNSIEGVGQEFMNVETLRDTIRNYCIAICRDFVFVKNDRDRVTVECVYEGCEWRIHASRLGNGEKFAIKKMHCNHTCGGGLQVRSHPKASKRWVSKIVKDQLQDMPLYKPSDIVKDIRRQYGVELPYHQAWHGKEVAMMDLYGNSRLSYERIRWYCDAIRQTNPGSIAEYETIDGRFRRLFICFHASLMGFIKGCRPLIFMDGTFIKHKDGGVLLGATSKDGNDDMFPIAYGVVDIECDENWEWFCRFLKEAIHSCTEYSGQQFTFMTDRHQGIIKSVPKYFPDSYHSYCIRHVKENFKNQVLVHYRAAERKSLINLLNAAAYTPRLTVFRKLIAKLTSEAPGATTFLLHAKPEHWANAVFPGPRWGIMTSNVAESFNSWVLEARHLPVPQMVDHIRIQIMQMMHQRRNRGYSIQSQLCPDAEKVLQKNAEDGRRLAVFTSNIMIYDVKDTNYSCKVDLHMCSCSCGEWRIFRMPCKHACACIEKDGRSLYQFTDNCFQAELYRVTYAEAISPIPDMEKPQSASEEIRILPPIRKTRPGRPKKKRRSSQVESVREMRCGRCGKVGHNRRTCNEVIK